MREHSGHLERVRRLRLPEKGKIVAILEGHRRIIEAIAAKDAEAAIAANIPAASLSGSA